MFDINLTFIVSFLIFPLVFFISYRLIYLTISREFFRYDEQIRENLQEALRLTREAERLENESKKIIEDARERALRNYKVGIQEASERSSKMIQLANESSNKRLQEKVAEIEREKEKMMKEIPKISEAISKDILRRILGREV